MSLSQLYRAGSRSHSYLGMGISKIIPSTVSSRKIANMNEPITFDEPVLLTERDAQVPDEKATCGQIARTARVLRQAEIPHILWGWWAAAYNAPKRSKRVSEHPLRKPK